ncbi:hypothetical protein SKAU_G00057130 [Synaphobranchus kaupii]|uniref:CYRIA/CYRIB Rac1 binding domain-containing protein n=1 Tax=Synaphobranchus kaupii TaxID=118154 RepID=A0A9Q1G512_SYNKA|nr:hypothetical protein SKAU_G00057130 [Synaphobranchus kaupii]
MPVALESAGLRISSAAAREVAAEDQGSAGVLTAEPQPALLCRSVNGGQKPPTSPSPTPTKLRPVEREPLASQPCMWAWQVSRVSRYLNMGNLLKVLTCTDLEQGPNFFLDFENAQPTEPEREVWDQVNVVLKDARGILDDLQDYKGAGEEIREAIQNPSDEGLQEKAWGAVVPLVGKLKKFYEFSQRLGMFPPSGR